MQYQVLTGNTLHRRVKKADDFRLGSVEFEGPAEDKTGRDVGIEVWRSVGKAHLEVVLWEPVASKVLKLQENELYWEWG